jgi:hypothetical protein
MRGDGVSTTDLTSRRRKRDEWLKNCRPFRDSTGQRFVEWPMPGGAVEIKPQPPALSIRQPWAWLIVNGHKDIENRTWATKHRGAILVHAPQKMDQDALEAWRDGHCWRHIPMPPLDELHLGGVVGRADILQVVQSDPSHWFQGPIGFVLGNAHPLSFRPCPGKRGHLFAAQFTD